MIMQKNLRATPAHFKAVSICNDLSEEERITAKALMEETEEKKNSSTHEYTVIGPPWNMEIKEFQIRT